MATRTAQSSFPMALRMVARVKKRSDVKKTVSTMKRTATPVAVGPVVSVRTWSGGAIVSSCRGPGGFEGCAAKGWPALSSRGRVHLSTRRPGEGQRLSIECATIPLYPLPMVISERRSGPTSFMLRDAAERPRISVEPRRGREPSLIDSASPIAGAVALTETLDATARVGCRSSAHWAA